MATVSVIGELLSMMGVLSPSYRHYVVGSWIMFHTGIVSAMPSSRHVVGLCEMATVLLTLSLSLDNLFVPFNFR